MGQVQYRGGFANVFKFECGGREIAIKVLLHLQGLTWEEMRKVSQHWRTSLLCPSMNCVYVL